MQLNKNEIHFTRKDYRKFMTSYQEGYSKSYKSEELLLVAKAYFIQQLYDECVSVLKLIKDCQTAKIFFEKAALLFKAQYLFDRTNTDELRAILNGFQLNKVKVNDKKINAFHQNVFRQFRYFLEHELNIKSEISHQSDFIHNQDEKLKLKQKQIFFQKSPKRQGFPCFLVSSHWRLKQQSFNSNTKFKVKIREKNGKIKQVEKEPQHPGPISNFCMINHIFQFIPYENKANQFLNIILFPDSEFQVVTKGHWNLLKKLFHGFPVKRIYSLSERLSSQTTFNQKMTAKVSINIKNDRYCLQTYFNATWQYGVLPYLIQKYGTGQLKLQNSQNNYQLVGFGKVFEPQNMLPFKYITFENKNIRILTVQQLRLQQKFHQIYDFEKYQFQESPSKGLVGLTNDKFLCFMNSTLQCLSHTYRLSKFFVQNHYVQFLNYSKNNLLGSRGEIACSYADIIKSIWNFHKESQKNSETDPSMFKNVFAKRFQNFVQDSQEDAHQFLNFLLNCLHDDLNKRFKPNSSRNLKMIKDSKSFESVRNTYIENYQNYNNSKITELFSGYTYSTLHCLGCESNYYNFDMHLTIPVPLPYVNPSMTIHFLSNQNIQDEAVRFKLYLNGIQKVEDLIKVVELKIDEKKKKYSNQISQFFLLGIDKRTLRVEHHFGKDSELKKLTHLQSTTYMFLYEITRIVKQIKSNNTFKDDPSAQKISEGQSHNQIALIEYKTEDTIQGYPKIVLLDPFDPEEDLLKLAAQSLCDQSLNVSGGLATQKQKEQCIQRIKLQKVKGMPYSYVLKALLSKKLDLFRQPQRIQQIGKMQKFGDFTLESCLSIFKQKDTILIQEEWRCGKCKNICAAEKQEKIYSIGPNLIIVLKRFKEGEKIYIKIEYPVYDLDMTTFVDQRYKQMYPQIQFKYDLYGVVVHRGTLNRGHYYSYCKNQMTNKWYLFDDEMVREQTDQAAIVDQNAYILFYNRKDS